jgi:hypothetical protein
VSKETDCGLAWIVATRFLALLAICWVVIGDLLEWREREA